MSSLSYDEYPRYESESVMSLDKPWWAYEVEEALELILAGDLTEAVELLESLVTFSDEDEYSGEWDDDTDLDTGDDF